ncbi:MAG: TetR/AcrR family transcriptional regulator [Bacteroidales bacterium]|nr:TetR/AcrR family transcriptional regulator [Bacteroidales bacterium]
MESQKNYIIKKAGELFNLYGLKSVTMDDISREAGISKKTLYIHFDSKKDLINYLLQQSKEQLEIRFKRIQNQDIDSLEKLFEIYNEFTEFLNEVNTITYWSFKKHYPELHTNYNDFMGALIDNVSVKVIIEAQWDNHILSKINARVFSYILRNSLIDFPETTIIRNVKFDHQILQKEVFYYCLRSVATVSGLNKLETIKNKPQDIKMVSGAF